MIERNYSNAFDYLYLSVKSIDCLAVINFEGELKLSLTTSGFHIMECGHICTKMSKECCRCSYPTGTYRCNVCKE